MLSTLVGSMSHNSWPTLNVFNGYFVAFVSHIASFGHFLFSVLLLEFYVIWCCVFMFLCLNLFVCMFCCFCFCSGWFVLFASFLFFFFSFIYVAKTKIPTNKPTKQGRWQSLIQLTIAGYIPSHGKARQEIKHRPTVKKKETYMHPCLLVLS